jgi:hypothetical protein
VKANPTSVADHLASDSERLLALSSLLRKSSREFEFLLQGKSMGSTLPEGSRIRVRPAGKETFKVGQVLTYVAADRVFVHRVVRFVRSGNNQYLITRGDRTVCCDLPVLEASVLGIVTEFSAAGAWRPVGPPPEKWFGFRWMASAIASLVGGLLRISPSWALWAARRIIGIHGVTERATGFLKRTVALGVRAGVAV